MRSILDDDMSVGKKIKTLAEIIKEMTKEEVKSNGDTGKDKETSE